MSNRRMCEAVISLRTANHLQARRTRLAWRSLVAEGVEVAAKKELRWGRHGFHQLQNHGWRRYYLCLLYTSPSPRDATLSRMPSSA